MPDRPTVIDATTALPVRPPPRARPRPSANPTWHELRGPFWPLVRLGLALGWLLAVAALLLTGERASTVDSLLTAAAHGDVDEVRVTGEPLPLRGRGAVTLEVRWSEGPFDHVARIVEARPGRGGPGLGAPATTGDRVVTTDAVAYLEARTDGVTVRRSLLPPAGAPTTEIGPWRAPNGVGSAMVLLGLGTLFLLVLGPQTWRATRWAWFWLFGVAPLGVPAFLLLSGPVPGTPPPRVGARRLTGGWALLLVWLVLGPLVGGLGGW